MTKKKKKGFNAVCLRTMIQNVKTILILTAFLLEGLFWSELQVFDQSERTRQRDKNQIT